MPGGWLNTGDLGYIDNEGWVFITGRSKDIIIRSGHNIDPSLIESVAEAHPAVIAAAAIGQPDLRAGEVPVVFVKLAANATDTADDICQYIRENVAEGPAKPTAVYVLSSLPCTAVGKIYRPALRCLVIEMLIKRNLATIMQSSDYVVSVENVPNAGLLASVFIGGSIRYRETITATVRERLSHYSFASSVI